MMKLIPYKRMGEPESDADDCRELVARRRPFAGAPGNAKHGYANEDRNFEGRRFARTGCHRMNLEMIATAFLLLFGIYLVCGLLFAIPFVLDGAGKIDPRAKHGSWGFRLLLIPGTMALWPLLACRWFKGVDEPPEENNSHRCAARRKPSA